MKFEIRLSGHKFDRYVLAHLYVERRVGWEICGTLQCRPEEWRALEAIFRAQAIAIKPEVPVGREA